MGTMSERGANCYASVRDDDEDDKREESRPAAAEMMRSVHCCHITGVLAVCLPGERRTELSFSFFSSFLLLLLPHYQIISQFYVESDNL